MPRRICESDPRSPRICRGETCSRSPRRWRRHRGRTSYRGPRGCCSRSPCQSIRRSLRDRCNSAVRCTQRCRRFGWQSTRPWRPKSRSPDTSVLHFRRIGLRRAYKRPCKCWQHRPGSCKPHN
jgi:hypothetical protein